MTSLVEQEVIVHKGEFTAFAREIFDGSNSRRGALAMREVPRETSQLAQRRDLFECIWSEKRQLIQGALALGSERPCPPHRLALRIGREAAGEFRGARSHPAEAAPRLRGRRWRGGACGVQ